MTLTLTARDLDLIETLTRRVRLLTVGQAAQIYWPKTVGRRTALRRLRQLAKSDWLDLHTVNAHPLLPVGKPLFMWQPDGPAPDVELVSQQLRGRWCQPARATRVCVASSRAACLLGSTARGLPPREHRDHDLRLAAVYLHYRTSRPRLAASWMGEHALAKAGYRIKDPDAFLRDSAGRIVRVIESAGRYSARQVESFHEHCRENNLSYELW